MKGEVFACQQDDIEYLKFTGVVRYSNCGGLEKHIETMFSGVKERRLLIDLKEAEILDSTALGLLAKLAIKLKEESNPRAILFLSSGELENIIRRICFDQIFQLLKIDTEPFKEISASQPNMSKLSQQELLQVENLYKKMRDKAKLEPELLKNISSYQQE